MEGVLGEGCVPYRLENFGVFEGPQMQFGATFWTN